jgi:hypothetical protein
VVLPNGRVHKSVAGSFTPRKIMAPLYRTMQLVLSNVTVHPASVRTRIPNSEAIDRSGIMCPVSTVGSPSILMSHMCVDKTIRLSANATFSGCVVVRLLTTGVPSITKIWVAPESAMASYMSRRKPANPALSVFSRWSSACSLNDLRDRLLDDTLEMITVASSSMSSSADEHTLRGYDECC